MLISIIITLYNRKELVERAIDSVSHLKKLNDVEIIVVDDGSTDNPKSVLLPYITSSTITYLYKDNGGAADAKNYGAKNAKGDYIIFLDSDDYLINSNELMQYITVKKNEGFNFFYSECVVIKKGSAKKELFSPKDFADAKNVYDYVMCYPLNYPGKPTYVFEREHFLNSGGFTKSFKWGDAMLFWRLFLKGIKCDLIRFPTYIYDQSSDNSISRSRGGNYYNNVYNSLKITYFKLEPDLNALGYQMNWVLILWLLSIKTCSFKDFIRFSVEILSNPIQSISATRYLITKRSGRR
ncbi:glycosyltransferase family 2 protein [Scandinavium sp. NPDC088450]|uniref:glycosyltransferase family 2 protein n=1 Tax=Scandinavium sp. NPDC088450 TaxID=3364514 RepID=UPI00384D5A05